MATEQDQQPSVKGQDEAEDRAASETLSASESEAQESADVAPDPAAETQEYLRLLQRERADFANYRRRMDEERLQLTRDANVQLLLRLLPIVDDLERVIANAAPDDLESTWGQGVALVERKLRSFVAAEDVQRIEAEGIEFNPWEHEAISYQPTADVDEGHILHVIRPGYRKGDRVIRPAQVIVAGRP